MAKKPKYETESMDYTPQGGFKPADLTFNLPGPPGTSGPVKGVGIPFSKAAFDELKARFHKRKAPTDTQWVTFGREAILTILAQNDCAGIKFYFVERMNTTSGQLTLVMVGVDVNNNDLTTEDTSQAIAGSQTTLYSENGNGFPP